MFFARMKPQRNGPFCARLFPQIRLIRAQPHIEQTINVIRPYCRASRRHKCWKQRERIFLVIQSLPPYRRFSAASSRRRNGFRKFPFPHAVSRKRLSMRSVSCRTKRPGIALTMRSLANASPFLATHPFDSICSVAADDRACLPWKTYSHHPHNASPLAKQTVLCLLPAHATADRRARRSVLPSADHRRTLSCLRRGRRYPDRWRRPARATG